MQSCNFVWFEQFVICSTTNQLRIDFKRLTLSNSDSPWQRFHRIEEKKIVINLSRCKLRSLKDGWHLCTLHLCTLQKNGSINGSVYFICWLKLSPCKQLCCPELSSRFLLEFKWPGIWTGAKRFWMCDSSWGNPNNLANQALKSNNWRICTQLTSNIPTDGGCLRSPLAFYFSKTSCTT